MGQGYDFGPGGFVAQEVEERKPFQPLPIGKYEVSVLSADMTDWPKRNQSGFVLQMEVLNGEYQRRRLFCHFILVGNSDAGEKVTKERLSRLAFAVGKRGLNNTNELIGECFIADVTINKNGYQEVRDFLPIAGTQTVAAQTQAVGNDASLDWD